MENGQLNWIAGFIWGIADDVLRDVYVRGKYRDVILPMTVIRRLDAVLEPTKEAVLKLNKQLDKAGVANKHAALGQASGNAFYNVSPFTLRDLRARAKQQQLKADFEAYLDGFSPNVQEILDKFKFRNQIPTLVEADILGSLIEKFTSSDINLSPNPVHDSEGKVRLPALDNHAMGTIFEELIRRFNEENNEEAGEHFTPRDVVRLMANLIFYPVADDICDATYRVYDGACGTGGMLTVAEETLSFLACEHGKEVSIHLFGQEINPETYAITKADLLLKGEGSAADNMKFGSTLSSDAFPSMEFDFMLSNPPYGKSWKTDLERMGGKKDQADPRFTIQHQGPYNDKPEELSLVTRSSDGQLMFLVNKLTKMNHATPLGSRIAEVHNGSSLLTGDAGQGESNIRRWIIENDWLEAIIALPLNMFYNTGIATYIWVLTNRKPKRRKGKIQLIDATGIYTPLRKNLGKKNCELSGDQVEQITKMFLKFKETDQSKIFPNAAFGYWKITVERPLRLAVHVTPGKLAAFKKDATKKLHKAADLLAGIAGGAKPHLDFNVVQAGFESALKKADIKLRGPELKTLYTAFTFKDESAQPVIKKKTKTGVEYEPDADLRDTEQVPLLEEGGVEALFQREVLPHVPDAWIDHSKTQIGYEISFTRHFYKPAPLRSLEEIKADLVALQAEAEGLLDEIVASAGGDA
jgi:type I restriction enzyme M protein